MMNEKDKLVERKLERMKNTKQKGEGDKEAKRRLKV